MDDVIVVVAEYPDQDIDGLKKIGVGAISSPGRRMDDIVQLSAQLKRVACLRRCRCPNDGSLITLPKIRLLAGIEKSTGPSPWYWATFPSVVSMRAKV